MASDAMHRRRESRQSSRTLSPFALTILGMENMNRSQSTEQAEEASGTASQPQVARQSRRAVSHYNFFQTTCSPATDGPPTYAIAAKQRIPQRQPECLGEKLPAYTCAVMGEAKLLLQLESTNPLHGVSTSEWKDVYFILRGTLMSFHRVKDSGPGKLLRSYTLQHAEIGVATDTQHTVLVPQTRLAHLIPSSQRRRAWQKDPELYKSVRQTVMRLRLETDQMLLADASEDRIHALIHAISAGIDVAHAIDERTIPRQCTIPRRRRRQRPAGNGDLSDPALLAEQEQILRDTYPAFAEASDQASQEPVRTSTQEATLEPLPTHASEEDDLDLAAIREDSTGPDEQDSEPLHHSTARPNMSRHTTASSMASSLSTTVLYASSPHDFDNQGKWRPPHLRSEVQIQRYKRRCMPLLLAGAARASDVLICHGKRVKINWRMELLEDWELKPPSYRSHGFSDGVLEAQRSQSTNSVTAPAIGQISSQSSSAELGPDSDQIEPAETVPVGNDLSKMVFRTKSIIGKGIGRREAVSTKVREVQVPDSEVPGAVFCF